MRCSGEASHGRGGVTQLFNEDCFAKKTVQKYREPNDVNYMFSRTHTRTVNKLNYNLYLNGQQLQYININNSLIPFSKKLLLH